MMGLRINLLVVAFLIFVCSCTSFSDENRAGILKEAFEKTMDGKQISIWTLKNKNGVEMSVTNFGGKVITLFVPDKNKKFVNVVEGFENIDKYIHSNEIYFGSAIGRVANRISLSKFVINGDKYNLSMNYGQDHLNGGVRGFHSIVWDVKRKNESTLELSYLSKDGEEGYPGNLKVKMVYKLTNENEFSIDYYATTDKPTICNFTHQSYFNLSGEGNETILDHVLQINADGFTATDVDLIPTGEIITVEGTPFDFRTPATIGDRIWIDYEPLKTGFGFDHNFVLSKRGKGVELAASVYSPLSGIEMDVYTDQPGIQFYSGNFLNGQEIGISKKPYGYRSAFCLETQHFPDSPNKPNFPPITLNPGQTYRHTCIYKFSVKQ
jgi:aldose 1-epimerase